MPASEARAVPCARPWLVVGFPAMVAVMSHVATASFSVARALERPPRLGAAGRARVRGHRLEQWLARRAGRVDRAPARALVNGAEGAAERSLVSALCPTRGTTSSWPRGKARTSDLASPVGVRKSTALLRTSTGTSGSGALELAVPPWARPGEARVRAPEVRRPPAEAAELARRPSRPAAAARIARRLAIGVPGCHGSRRRGRRCRARPSRTAHVELDKRGARRRRAVEHRDQRLPEVEE